MTAAVDARNLLEINASVVRALMQARHQNSSRGQFISEDPVFLGDPKQQVLTDPQSLNSYSYGNDNPISNKDPNGLGAGPAAIPFAIIVAILYTIAALLSSPQVQHASSQAASAIVNQSVQIVQTISISRPFVLPTGQTSGYNLAAPTIGQGKNFTPGQKKDAIEKNVDVNGQPTCVNCGTETVPPRQNKKGVTPPGNETQIDHRVPKAQGGTNDPSNADLLCRDCNLQKGSQSPQDFYGGNGLPLLQI